MILLCNTFITETKPTIGKGHVFRENLKSFSNFDIFKYSLASLAVAYPWSKVILKIELDPIYLDRKDELNEFINKEFSNFKLDLSWKRNEYQQDWIKTYENLNDELIWFYCNHDHIFYDSNTKHLEELVSGMREEPLCSLPFSHWPECIRTAKLGGSSPPMNPETYQFHNTHISINNNCFDSIQIITKDLYYEWWCTGDFNNIKLPRPDYFGTGLAEIKPIPNHKLIIPLKEICRHFDGYQHIPPHLGGPIDNNQCPALDIPIGFFNNNIKIRYGYDDYKEGWTNINPKNQYYYAFNKLGTDYKFTLEDLPLVWKSKISKVDSNPNLDEEELTQYRLKSILETIHTNSQLLIDGNVETQILNNYLKNYKFKLETNV
jgi:hypothetical protein|tara:strand:+ start:1300 stop:2427 length:1128 start_codon:yes stop_codon:yes gene_type:complete